MNAVARVTYQVDDVHYSREYFASQRAEVVLIRLAADRLRSYSGSIQLGDAHGATVASTDDKLLTAAGVLNNGMKYQSQVLVRNDGGSMKADTDSSGHTEILFQNCDALTLILGAGTSYVPDASKHFDGGDPGARVAEQVQSAARLTYDRLKADHEKDFRAIFDRVSLNLGAGSSGVEALPTEKRIAQAVARDDPELAQLLFQYGRYNLISCSRSAMPANLQGLWNDDNNQKWASDYHSNINVEMELLAGRTGKPGRMPSSAVQLDSEHARPLAEKHGGRPGVCPCIRGAGPRVGRSYHAQSVRWWRVYLGQNGKRVALPAFVGTFCVRWGQRLST